MCTMSSAALLFCLASAVVTVSFSTDVPTEIYGIKGQSIRLDIPAKPKVSLSKLEWELQATASARTIIVRNKTVAPKYRQKVEFFDGNFSIQLTNLNEKDSGIYAAINTEGWEDKALVSYKLVIMEAVSKPIIKIPPVRPHGNSSGRNGNSSGRNCGFHVNCSSSGLWASYSCDENHCSPLQSPLATSVNITISRRKGHIECRVSNRVSTETGSLQLPENCLEDSLVKQSLDPDLRWTVLLSVIVASLLLLVCIILIVRRFRKKPTEMEDTPHKHHDIPTVIVTESDADEPSRQEGNSIYSVVNKAARCLVASHEAPITLKNQTSRSVDTEGEHRSQRQQRNKRKQRPQEDKNMTIYTTATKPLEKQRPLEDTDRTIYSTATKPLEEQRPLEDTDRTIYDTTRTQQNEQLPPLVTNTSQSETNQADTVYYTLGHMNSGQH